MIVLDISGAALARARARVGDAGATWIEADVTGEWSAPDVDIWHDRAAFHFLTDASDRAAYVTRLRRQVRPGGHVIIATFALDAPPRCSGLPVMRYSPASLSAELGSAFDLVESVDERHLTPSGQVQPFSYCRFTFRGPVD